MFDAVRWAGLAVGLLVAGLVYVDASRQGLDRALPVAVVVGTIAAGGFVAPASLYELVYRGVESGQAVARPPRTLFGGMAVTGLLVATAAVLLYGLASRLRNHSEGR